MMLAARLTYKDILLSKPTKQPLPPLDLYLNDILYSRLNHNDYIGVCIDMKNDKLQLKIKIKSKEYKSVIRQLSTLQKQSLEWLNLKEVGKSKVQTYPKLLIKVQRIDRKGNVKKTVVDNIVRFSPTARQSVQAQPNFSSIDSESIIKKITDDIIMDEEYSFEGRPISKTYRDKKDEYDIQQLDDRYRSQYFENLNRKREITVRKILKSFEDVSSPSVLPTTFDLY